MNRGVCLENKKGPFNSVICLAVMLGLLMLILNYLVSTK